MALARRISDANLRGHKSRVSIFTGASTGPELDGALAMAGGIQLRLPYTNPIPRPASASTLTKWSTWTSTSATSPKYVEYGFLGKMDWALVRSLPS
jgi:succinyl-CoA:acetate CoA-transferase